MPRSRELAELATSYDSGGSLGFRNRIINPGMVIDQRNNGASVTITNTSDITYVLDRWFGFGTSASKFSVQRNAGSVTPPTGFSNYFGVTSLSAYTVGSGDSFTMGQYIEGFNTADLGWGTANAQTITLSFWVRSSLTGTFGGALRNSDVNRGYPFAYTINAANTWEQKSIVIAGDTSGTWVGATNGAGIRLGFGLGVGSTFSGTAGAWAAGNLTSATGATSVVGTNGATFYITGVQLEAGSVATPFERRDYGRELMMAQRYFQFVNVGWVGSTTATVLYGNGGVFQVAPRVQPTIAWLASGGLAGFANSSGTATFAGSNSGFYYYKAATTSANSNAFIDSLSASAEL
jgi:hypothetical protein